MNKLFNLLAALLLLVSSFGCSNIPIYDQKYDQEDVYLEQQQTEKIPTKSFVVIETLVVIETEESTFPLSYGSGSGVVIGETKDGGSFILTAGHVCSPKSENIIKAKLIAMVFPTKVKVKSVFKIKNLNLDETMATVVKLEEQPNFDICLLHSEEKIGNSVKIAESAPKFGDEVFNISAPNGEFSRDSAYIVSGFYSGETTEIDLNKQYCTAKVGSCSRAKFSLKIVHGCSGSPITNENGELVSIVTSYYIKFDELSYGPTYQFLKEFLNGNI